MGVSWGGGPTRLGPAGLLQERCCSRVGLQNGAQEAAEEEEEAGRAFGLSELGRARSETSLWSLSTLPHPKGVEGGEPPTHLEAAVADVLAVTVTVGEIHLGPGLPLAVAPWGRVAQPVLVL